MQATTLSFRVGSSFLEQTRSVANMLGMKGSAYIRQAIAEKNQRVMADRIATLSKKLAADHLAFNEELEGALTDGLD